MSESNENNNAHDISAQGKALFRKFECPFDLESIFTLQYNVQGLKSVLEFILEHMGEMKQSTAAALQATLKTTKDCADNSVDLAQLKQICKELEAKSVHHDAEIADCNTATESNTLNISLNQRATQESLDALAATLKDHQEQIDALKLGSGGSVDLSEMDKRYACKDAPDSTIDRIEALEAAVKTLKDANYGATLTKHWTEIEKLMGNSLAGSNNGDIDTDAVMRKIHALEKTVNEKADQVEVNKNKTLAEEKLADAQSENEKAFAASRNEVGTFREEYFMFVSKDHVHLEQRVTTLEKKFSTLSKNMEGMGSYAAPTGNVDADALGLINSRLADLEANYEDLRDQFAKWMKQMQELLDGKADRSELEELEKTMMNRLNDIITALTKQFADKAETKKALKLLERQLKNLYDLFMSKGGYNNEEEAMFSKKPLGGFSCASCEKDLVNLHGKKVEFMPWSKLPFRDPAERIARVGQGFSKMLSMINPEQLSGMQNSKLHDAYQSQKMAHTTSHFGQGGYGNEQEETTTRFPNAVKVRGGSQINTTGVEQISPDGRRPGSGSNRKIRVNGPRISKK